MKKLNLCSILLLIILILCSCNSTPKSATVDCNQHPSVELSYSDDVDLHTDVNHVNEYFKQHYYQDGLAASGADEDVFYCTYDVISNADAQYEVFYSFKGMYTYVYIGDQLVDSFTYDLNKTLDFIDVIKTSDDSYIFLAIDSDLDYLLMPIKNHELIEFINIGNEYQYSNLFCDSKNNLYIASSECVIQLDNMYEKKNDYIFKGPASKCVWDNDLLYYIESTYEFDEKQLIANRIVSINSLSLPSLKKTVVADITCASNFIAEELYIDMLVDEDDVIFTLENGIYCYSRGNGKTEMLLNAIDYGFEDIDLLSYDGEKVEFYTNYYTSSGEYKNSNVSFNRSNNSDEKQKIIVGVFSYGDCIRAFEEINRKESEYYICVVNYNMYNSSVDDYINLINGKDDLDMIVFDKTMYPIFNNADFLLDLNTLNIDYGELIDSIRQTTEVSGSRYSMFTSFDIRLLAYNTDLFENDDLLPENALKNNTINLTGNQSIESLVDTYYGIFNKEIQLNGKVSENTVKSFLELCNECSKSDCNEYSMIKEISTGEILFNDLRISSVEQFYAMASYYGPNLGIANPWGYDSVGIIPDDFFGICSGSDNVDICIEVINELLSEEIQDSLDFPVNKNSFDKKLANLTAMNDEEVNSLLLEYRIRSTYEEKDYINLIEQLVSLMQSGIHQSYDTSDEDESFLKEIHYISGDDFEEYVIEILPDIIDDASSVIIMDNQVVNILISEAKECLYEGKSIESVSKSATNRINLYLDE